MHDKDYIRKQCIRAEALLRAIYYRNGPQTAGKIVRADRFARLTRKEVDSGWDFPDRHLMHRIAKVISS